MPRMKTPTLQEQAEAAIAPVLNAIESEHGVPSRGDLRTLIATARALADRVTKANGLIDGYGLNKSNPAGLRAASDRLVADAATRHPKLHRFKR